MAITLLRPPQHSECGVGGADRRRKRRFGGASAAAAAAANDPDLLTRTSWTDAHVALVQIKKV